MREYFGKVGEHKKSVRISVGCLGAYMVFQSIYTGNYIFAMLGVAVIVSVFFRKQQVVSEKGVELRYSIFGIPFDNVWKWDEVTSIHLKYVSKAAPDVEVHIGKDIITRSYIMSEVAVEGLKELAAEFNHDLVVATME